VPRSGESIVTVPPERLAVDLSHHFRALGAQGAFVLCDVGGKRMRVHDGVRARQGFLPAYFFATQISSSEPEFPMRRAQQEITRGALHELRVLP